MRLMDGFINCEELVQNTNKKRFRVLIILYKHSCIQCPHQLQNEQAVYLLERKISSAINDHRTRKDGWPRWISEIRLLNGYKRRQTDGDVTADFVFRRPYFVILYGYRCIEAK